MSATIQLTPNEVKADRPFTHPRHIVEDRTSLSPMLAQLCLLLDYPHLPVSRPRTVLFQATGANSWFHRLVLARADNAWMGQRLTIVGFFGQRRADADLALAHEFDRLLIAEIPDFPGLCSYSTMAIGGGNYGNLVVFSDGQARHQWSASRAHSQAVTTLSPNYYLTVTIYHGELPKGLMQPDELKLTRAKYFDYQSRPRWEALREIKPDGRP